MASANSPDLAGRAKVIWSSNSIAPPQSSRALLFESSSVNFAVAAEHVVEVIELPAVNPVAGSPAWFNGLAVYKSRPAPVIDVGGYFDLGNKTGSQKDDLQSRSIVVQVAGSSYLLAVDKVLNLGELPLANASADAQYSTGSSTTHDLSAHRAIERFSYCNNKLIAIVNIPELLRLTKFLRECQVV